MNFSLKNNLANILTILRICLIPVFIILFISSNIKFSLFIFIFAAITDFLDGYIARKLKQESTFGQILDPLADKLLTISAFILLIQTYNINYLTIPIIIMISRDIIISSLRQNMLNKKNMYINVDLTGKLKTLFQLLGIIILLYNVIILSNTIQFIGCFIIYLSLLLSLISLFIYIKVYLKLDSKR